MEQKGINDRWLLATVALCLLSVTAGCTSLRQWFHNGFKVGPNYRQPGVMLPERWPDEKSATSYDAFESEPTNDEERIKKVGFESPQDVGQDSEAVELPGPDPRMPPLPFNSSLADDADVGVVPLPAVTEELTVLENLDLADSWWHVLNDPALEQLIELARSNNLDLRKAAYRVSEARSQDSIAVGNLFPQAQNVIFGKVDGRLAEKLTQSALEDTFDIWALGPLLSWELDVWGRIRRNADSSQATLEARVEDYRNVLVILIGDVASNYIQYRYNQTLVCSLEESLKDQDESIELLESRLQEGFETRISVYSARVARANTAAQIPPLRTAMRQASNRICVLLGLPVQELPELEGVAPIPDVPAQITIGIPADLLRRRPDIRAAERVVAAQSEQIGIALADLYPSFSLSGFFGSTTSRARELFDEGSFTSIVVPGLSWKILNYRRLLGNVEVQDARLQQAILDYQQTVLKAGEEVDANLVALYNARDQLNYTRESVVAGKKLLELTELQYEKGEVGYDKVLDAHSKLARDERALAGVRQDLALHLVVVYKAMGGGWQSSDCFTCL